MTARLPVQHLKSYSYYGTGGTCAQLYAPSTIAELAAVVRDVHVRGQDLQALGAGTNSLVMDDHYPGAFVVFKNLRRLEHRGAAVFCGAGIDNSALAAAALGWSLTGAAWMHRLPGQLGGTVRMNARCYGGEMSQIVRRVWAVSRTGDIGEHSGSTLFRGYKDTVFMDNGALIAELELELGPGDPEKIRQAMDACENDRVAKGQFDYPSCGCVFKNDYGVGLPSGMLLEAAGLKNLRHGGAVVSPKHANFVFNQGATSRDILELTLTMRERVYDAFGVWLAYEMEVLGLVPSDLRARLDEKRPAVPDEARLAPLRQRFHAPTKS